MKNTYSVFVEGDEYTCVQNFDIDTNSDNVDVYVSMTNKYVGEVYDIVIPDIDSEGDEIKKFERIIADFIGENY